MTDKYVKVDDVKRKAKKHNEYINNLLDSIPPIDCREIEVPECKSLSIVARFSGQPWRDTKFSQTLHTTKKAVKILIVEEKE